MFKINSVKFLDLIQPYDVLKVPANAQINGRLFAAPLNGLLDASLLFLISKGIFQDFRSCQFLNQHPILANINDNHEGTGHFVWILIFDL